MCTCIQPDHIVPVSIQVPSCTQLFLFLVKTLVRSFYYSPFCCATYSMINVKPCCTTSEYFFQIQFHVFVWIMRYIEQIVDAFCMHRCLLNRRVQVQPTPDA